MTRIAESELILNPRGSIYHLDLLPEEIADTIITVGDPERVKQVSRHFDKIQLKKRKREFVTHTGRIGKKRLTVISTGIGTDNIDIVLTELDALVNIDLKNRTINEKKKKLDIIRIGTSGALHADVKVDSFLASSHGLGLDGLMLYYQQKTTEEKQRMVEAIQYMLGDAVPMDIYLAAGSRSLIKRIGKGWQTGITATCTGFYGPQGRVLRGKLRNENMLDLLRDFSFADKRITNFEMETAGIYGMAKMLGHRAISCNAILANRATGTYSKRQKKTVNKLIKTVLERIVS